MDDTHPVQPVTREEIAHDCWHHRGYNRWFDKSVQWIVFEDGRAGMIGEHVCGPEFCCEFYVTHLLEYDGRYHAYKVVRLCLSADIFQSSCKASRRVPSYWQCRIIQ